MLQRMPQYEKAAKRVLRELDVHLADMPYSACCGAPLESFTDEWLYLAAYNLSRAETMELDILALCGNCASTLSRAIEALKDPLLTNEANDRLGKIGLRYRGKVGVKHLVRVLSEHLDDLKEQIGQKLPLKVALTHPCQAFRPHTLLRFDDPLQPRAMRDIVELTGAEVITYKGEYDCCGSTLYLADEELALKAGQQKLRSAAGADVLINACGNCQLLLERFQDMIRQQRPVPKLPVMTLPQLLGLAMGIDAAELVITPATAERLSQSAT